MVKKAEELLNAFKSEMATTGAFAASRSGVYIAGPVPEGHHRDTFIAMAAIIHGGAETSALELKSHVKTIVVNFSDSQMLIVGVGSRALLGVTAPEISEGILAKSTKLAKELEELV